MKYICSRSYVFTLEWLVHLPTLSSVYKLVKSIVKCVYSSWFGGLSFFVLSGVQTALFIIIIIWRLQFWILRFQIPWASISVKKVGLHFSWLSWVDKKFYSPSEGTNLGRHLLTKRNFSSRSKFSLAEGLRGEETDSSAPQGGAGRGSWRRIIFKYFCNFFFL